MTDFTQQTQAAAKMVVASAMIGSVSYTALGHTKEEAGQALTSRWGADCKRLGRTDLGEMQEIIEGGDVQFINVAPGTAVIYGYDS